MGASESTARSTKDEEPEPNEENNSSMGAATAVATAAAGVAFAAWGISKMLSDNKNTEETSHHVRHQAMNQRSILSPGGPYKMNTDAACRPTFTADHGSVQLGPSGYGGILRDRYGQWVVGFIGFIGVADSLTSELNGILKGLELLDKRNLHGSILETDCQAAYQWVTSDGDDCPKKPIIKACWWTIDKCRKLIEKNNIEVTLVKGEANRCADKLAAMAVARRELYVEFKDCPLELKDLVEKDAGFNG